MDRRGFLLATAAGMLAAGGDRTALANLPEGKFELGTLHESAARRAKALAAGRPVELKILLPKGSTANIKPLARAFKAASGVSFRFVETAVDEINSTMIVDALSDSASFDLALPATFGLPDLAEAGAITKLDSFAARYEPEDFQSDALFPLGDYYLGNLYGYQTDGDAYLMFYNRDWLEDPEEQDRFADQHGYELAVPKTWQELDAMMAFFHRPDRERYGGALFRTPTYIAWEFWIRYHAKGFWPFDEEMMPQIDNEAGVEALEELIAASKHLYPAARSNGLFENWRAFSTGHIFCNVGWGGTQKFLNKDTSAVRGRLAYGPTPGGLIDGKLLVVPYFNWGWNYAVSSRSAEPEIAYLFALYACSPKMSTLAVREQGGFFDPFRKEHYSDPKIIQTYSADFLSAHRESMTDSIPDLYLKGQGEYFDALRDNLSQADSGVITARDALQRTAKQWRRTTRRMGRSRQQEQWAFLRSRYPAGIRQLLR